MRRGSGAAVGANSCADQNVIQVSGGVDWECSCVMGTGATLLIRRRVALSACRALKAGGATGLGGSCDPPFKRVQRKNVERGSDVFQQLAMVGEEGSGQSAEGVVLPSEQTVAPTRMSFR